MSAVPARDGRIFGFLPRRTPKRNLPGSSTATRPLPRTPGPSALDGWRPADFRADASAQLTGPADLPPAGMPRGQHPYSAALPPDVTMLLDRAAFTPSPDHDVLTRVRDSLRNLPDAPASVPAVSPARSFASDLRKPWDGGLPVFARVVRQYGFCGLHMEHGDIPARAITYVTPERWAAALDAIRGVTELALSDLAFRAAQFNAAEAPARARAIAAKARLEQVAKRGAAPGGTAVAA